MILEKVAARKQGREPQFLDQRIANEVELIIFLVISLNSVKILANSINHCRQTFSDVQLLCCLLAHTSTRCLHQQASRTDGRSHSQEFTVQHTLMNGQPYETLEVWLRSWDLHEC